MENKKSEKIKQLDLDTIVAIGGSKHGVSGPVNPPVYRASTILFENMEALRSSEAAPFEKLNYGRLGTPSTHATEDAIAELENGYRAVAGSSGLSVIIMALLAYTKTGGHILISDETYKGVSRFCSEVLIKYDVEVEFYPVNVSGNIEHYIRPNTCLIYVESPSTDKLMIADLPSIIASAQQHQIPVIVDNTWATPLYFQPLAMGADVVIHSASKYLCGHSDVLFGVAVCTKISWPVIKKMAFVLGVHSSPDDAYLTLRGLRTLAVRMDRHQANALELATWFEQQDEVESVLHPALPSHSSHALWRRDFTGASGRFAVKLKPLPARNIDFMIDSLELFRLGYSWGGCESIIMPEYQVNPTTGEAIDSYLRVSVGLENINNLRQDLERGFGYLRSQE